MRSCSIYISALTVATVVPLFSASLQPFFGFEFLVLDARTDRGSFTYGGPTNGRVAYIWEYCNRLREWWKWWRWRER